METLQTASRVERVRHELRRREVRVASVAPIGSEFVRVVFAGESLAGFTSLGFDDHVKFMVDGEEGGGGAEGGEPIRRDYTPRRFDAERLELTIDFALHGHGHASAWARNASIGQPAVIGGPKGSMIVPADFAWHLLAGDATAAPAIGRRLAELPAGAWAIVVAQFADLAILELEQSAARVELYQVGDAEALVQAIRSRPLPPGAGYAWCAGEASAMARARDALRIDHGHPKEAMRVAAYWKHGALGFHDELGR